LLALSALEEVCEKLQLTTEQCQLLAEYQDTLCGKVERRRSRWQQCIKIRRAGKPFDPEAIKQLAKEYREGKCP